MVVRRLIHVGTVRPGVPFRKGATPPIIGRSVETGRALNDATERQISAWPEPHRSKHVRERLEPGGSVLVAGAEKNSNRRSVALAAGSSWRVRSGSGAVQPAAWGSHAMRTPIWDMTPGGLAKGDGRSLQVH